jgi:hydrogenase/urease accessory protein HupE
MMRRFWLLLVIACWSRAAVAHEVGLSQGQYRRHGDVLQVELVLAQRDAATLLGRLDPDHDGVIDARALEPAREQLERSVLGSITVAGPSGRCVARLDRSALTERDGLLLAGQLRCAPADGPWLVTVGFVKQLARGHRHAARIALGSSARDELVYGDSPTLEIGPDSSASSQPEEPRRSVGFFRLGLEHILSGYDHLVFLVALVLAGGKLRSLLGVITAFTVGHSLSLALAALGVWAPAAWLIEPGIALSIGYVAIENILGLDPSKRWRITFPFGLLHGFGFSGALLDVGLPRAEIPSALLFFNVGVEVGQIALLCVALPLLCYLRDWSSLPRFALPALNASVAALSVVWFMQRVLA